MNNKPDIIQRHPCTQGRNYLWIWYCCRGIQGTTVLHHPGPFLAETTPSWLGCSHFRCEACDVIQERVPDDGCDVPCASPKTTEPKTTPLSTSCLADNITSSTEPDDVSDISRTSPRTAEPETTPLSTDCLADDISSTILRTSLQTAEPETTPLSTGCLAVNVTGSTEPESISSPKLPKDY
ncbi:hypothetical protein BDD12DRAFT_538462 [Trichophaea hybrida]|nr:hypothetical protein BDD12DRAFT_538462 [Trichophaea hybrida]